MDWLTTRPTPDEANHWLALLSLVLFAIGVVATAVLSTRPGSPPFGGRFTQKFVMRACTIIGWICGIGLFFGIIRLFQIDPATLGRPIWIVLTWVALVVAIGWLISTAPADMAQRRQNNERMAAKSKKPKAARKATP